MAAIFRLLHWETEIHSIHTPVSPTVSINRRIVVLDRLFQPPKLATSQLGLRIQRKPDKLFTFLKTSRSKLIFYCVTRYY